MTHETYISRKSRLLRTFDRSVARVRRVLITRYGEEQADALIRESHFGYEALIPQIPFIGDKNPFLNFLLPTTRFLAVYRALQKQGRTVEEAGQLVYEMSAADLKAIPGLFRRAIGYLWFTPWLLRRLKKREIEFREREYSGGYVVTCVQGDGHSFDYGVDYTECASCKFLDAQDALELAPYVCATDKVASEMLGWGLTRTMTLAEGFEKCDFRFKKGGKTRVAIPGSLKQEDMPDTALPGF
jgi:hypothetical protein